MNTHLIRVKFNHTLMTVKINDKPTTLADGATLADALMEAGVMPEGIATALNGTVVSSDKRASTQLTDGDNILIIKAFYGG